GRHRLHGTVVDAFEKQNPDLVLGERELRGRLNFGHDGGVLQGWMSFSAVASRRKAWLSFGEVFPDSDSSSIRHRTAASNRPGRPGPPFATTWPPRPCPSANLIRLFSPPRRKVAASARQTATWSC